MSEQLQEVVINERFDAIVEGERQRDIAVFEENLEELDEMPDEVERELRTISSGKMVGCQDTGGGGYEWEKITG